MPVSDDDKKELFTKLNDHGNRLVALEVWQKATQDALGKYVTVVEFKVVQVLVYGFVTISMMALVSALISTVLTKLK